MWYIVIFVLAAIGIIAGFAGVSSCSGFSTKVSDSPSDSIKGSYTKEEIKELLKVIANKGVKKDLNVGAMCYSPRPILERTEYICPVCSEKTVYTYHQAEMVQNEIPVCRSNIARFGGTTLRLDESQFCRKCTPDSIPEPKLCVIAKLSDAPETKTCGISSMDIMLLIEFFEGKNIHKTSNDGEVAMKEMMYRIEELIGVKNE